MINWTWRVIAGWRYNCRVAKFSFLVLMQKVFRFGNASDHM